MNAPAAPLVARLRAEIASLREEARVQKQEADRYFELAEEAESLIKRQRAALDAAQRDKELAVAEAVREVRQIAGDNPTSAVGAFILKELEKHPPAALIQQAEENARKAKLYDQSNEALEISSARKEPK